MRCFDVHSLCTRLKIQGTVFNSDMSGFTRITKKFGILHFLAMILKMRSIVRPIIASCGGKFLHYDGDNVIAVFPNPQVNKNVRGV